MLDTHCARKEDAEGFYRQALSVDTKHSYALYNLAVLLEEKLKLRVKHHKETEKDAIAIDLQGEKDEILEFYRQAVSCDPSDATATADYGRYMLIEYGQDKSYEGKAETFLLRALQLDTRCEVAMYNLALLYHRNKHDAFTSENYLRKMLVLNPKHVNAMHLLATIILETMRKAAGKAAVPSQSVSPLEEAFILYEKAITLSKNPSHLLSEYCAVVHALGSSKRRLAAVVFCSQPAFLDFRGRDIETALKLLQTSCQLSPRGGNP